MNGPESEALEAMPPWSRSPGQEPDDSVHDGERDPRKPKRPAVHRDDAVRPLNGHEWKLISEFAPQMPWNLRSAVSGSGARYEPGFSSSPDGSFVWETCQTLYATACHISKLSRISPSQVERQEGTGWLVVTFVRAKNGQVVRVPIPDDFESWVRRYLAKPKPSLGWSYNHMLNRLADFVFEKTEERLHLNSLRFRHSGIVRFKVVYNVSDRVAADWAGCTERTVQTYARMAPEELLIDLREKGLATTLFPPRWGIR